MKLFILSFYFCIFSVVKSSEIRREISFSNGQYIVGWVTNHETETIYFDVIVETRGFVGFGLSTNGGMDKADVIIGGVYDNGDSYFEDRYAEGKFMPKIDETQNWFLDFANENSTYTELKFHRILNTCDKEEDIAIQEDTIKIIWSFGANDTLIHHGVNRGSYGVYMLDPPIPPLDLSKFGNFTIKNHLKMPKDDTVYWCSIHKGPEFESKKHVVVLEHITETPEAVKHTHHFVIYKCLPPSGQNASEFFNQYLDKQGECYVTNAVVPYEHCITFIYDWSIGADRVVFPDNVGFPMGLEKDEYFMLEVHMDNPDLLEGVEFETGGTIYYTDEIREFDAAMLVIGHKQEPSFIIPPKIPDWVTSGHCSPTCTNRLPKSVNLFNAKLHSHISGRKMKLRHFRGDMELPWIAFDDNYDFNYQQMRSLRNERILEPGDQLTMECTYSSTWKNPPGTVIGGFSTREEMCEAYLYYYPANENLGFCLSYYENEEFFKIFGIEEIFLADGERDPLIIKPEKWANLRMTQVLDNNITWTEELYEKIRYDLRYGGHTDSCGIYGFSGYQNQYINFLEKTKKSGLISYPDIKYDYKPQDTCSKAPGRTQFYFSFTWISLLFLFKKVL